ncbi:hypothetical protein FOA52_002848 [Chlamydomonas sp. UWO 241]|nr:hypothetical protein FOA52_002848 [Chlamydomonas sp. UWO 241]
MAAALARSARAHCMRAGACAHTVRARHHQNHGAQQLQQHGGASATRHAHAAAGAAATPTSAPGLSASPGRGLLPVVYHPAYSAPLLRAGHRFPMQVFGTIHDRLLHHHRLIGPGQVHVPTRLPDDDVLALVHMREYVSAFSEGRLDDVRARRIGFGAALSEPVLIERTKAEVAGTLLTARLALRHGLACNTAGGTHHAFPSFGSGYCILNDLAVTTELLIAEGAVRRVLVLDLDVHQGDGTAAIFAGRKDVFTLSVHCESNFPARKQASTLDIGLPDGTGDDAYLSKIADVLPRVLSEFKPDLVLYDAGVDVHTADVLGRLCVSDEGLKRRELLVLDTVLAAGVPLAGYVGGGYDDDLNVLADRHVALHAAAVRMWGEYELS